MDTASRGADVDVPLVASKRKIDDADFEPDASDGTDSDSADDASEVEFDDDMIQQLVQLAAEATKDKTVWRYQDGIYVEVPNMSYKP
ncbi:hypothetical protein pqer_cds_945 [Pandoravirus quercus]|uniref:Uncharacterized protein n=2 Tax=Pandoravirus TaxID=2060084 RepID=A0A2U7UA96_9VIRU|nr:hypothetical protein pqer_cds_945 [Pandoravirus quercus]AVK75367.1 hypothetical protein pqer_cds_945 [Pandoravirus quercus]QBZ81545.1 hypothetical protein pclt_cds_959 [Pandoravirus celtis]